LADDEVEFITIMLFNPLDFIAAFAGPETRIRLSSRPADRLPSL